MLSLSTEVNIQQEEDQGIILDINVHSRPIAQMKCLGGSAGCKYMPSSMQCYNKGSDGRDVQVRSFFVFLVII